MDKNKKNTKEIKLILLGSGGVGKTSLAASLIKGLDLSDFNLNPSTEGIQINDWHISKEGKEFPEDIKVNVWDFGGQEIYHATHRFFLTKRSIYLLVTDPRRDDNEDDFFYWLNMINTQAKGCPVLLVMNKIDERYKELPVNSFKKHFDNIVGFNKVSCLPDFSDTIDNLRAEIKRIIFNDDFLSKGQTELPANWGNIKDEIDSIRECGIKYLSVEQFFKICQRNNLNEPNIAGMLSEYLHDVGFYLHFNKDLELRRTIFLDYKWLLAAIYKVLDDRETIKNGGNFTDNYLMRIWGDNEHFGVQPELISLMKLFEICFEINRGIYLAPQLLPIEQPEFEWIENKNPLLFEFHYEFMPKGIMSRFIVKRNRDIFQRKYWRSGAILEYEDAKAWIEEDQYKNKIFIKIIGDNKRELLSVIRKTLNEIHNSFEELAVEEMIPCTCSFCSSSSEPYFYSYENLIRRMKHNKKTIECAKSFDEVSVSNILEGVNMPSEADILKALDSITIKHLESGK